MTVLQAPRTRASSGATRSGQLFLLELSGGRIDSMDTDGSERTDEKPSEHSAQAVRAFGPEENSDLQPVGGPANAATQDGYLRGGLPPHVVRRVRDHIDSNFNQRIKVATLAKLANLSTWYFVRAFKQSVGVTPHDYLTRRRLEHTKELLSGTNMPLSQIALAAGFADQSHCARRFRQHIGMSPRDHRRGGRKSERRWRWPAAGRMSPSGP